jgi:DNA-binding transcriptional ArsR family regulator
METGVDDLYSQVFAALSEPIRLRMLRMIAATDELACTRLDETLPISKSTISYHIKVLYQARLISIRKDGRYYHYRYNRDALQQLLPEFVNQLSAGIGSAATAAPVSALRPRALSTRRAAAPARVRPVGHS